MRLGQQVGGMLRRFILPWVCLFSGRGDVSFVFPLLVFVGHYDRHGRSTRMFLWGKRRTKRATLP